MKIFRYIIITTSIYLVSCTYEDYRSTFLHYKLDGKDDLVIWASPRIGFDDLFKKKENIELKPGDTVYFPENVKVVGEQNHVTVSSLNASYDIDHPTTYGLDVHPSYPESFKLFIILPAKGTMPSENIDIN